MLTVRNSPSAPNDPKLKPDNEVAEETPGGFRLRGEVGLVARAVLALPERLVHPLRRRAASERVRRLRPASALIVCHGNICRSPYAAQVLAQEARNRGVALAVEDGGFFGADRPAHATAIAVARVRGIELDEHRSRLVTAEGLGAAELVVVMEPRQARRVRNQFGVPAERVLVLGDLDPGPIRLRSIGDPYGRPAAEFERTYDRIDRCIKALGELLSAT